MATKNQPGEFDCYANAHPDEAMFTLLGRDPDAPTLVEEWARRRELNGQDKKKVAEARQCAQSMRAWLVHLGKTERPGVDYRKIYNEVLAIACVRPLTWEDLNEIEKAHDDGQLPFSQEKIMQLHSIRVTKTKRGWGE